MISLINSLDSSLSLRMTIPKVPFYVISLRYILIFLERISPAFSKGESERSEQGDFLFSRKRVFMWLRSSEFMSCQNADFCVLNLLNSISSQTQQNRQRNNSYRFCLHRVLDFSISIKSKI